MTSELRPNRFFDDDKYRANANYEPGEWEQGADIVWHSSDSPTMPHDAGSSSSSTGGGFHTGTKDAAEERAVVRGGVVNRRDRTLHPLQMGGQTALALSRPVDQGDDYARYSSYGATDPKAYTPMGGEVRLRPGQLGHSAWSDDTANYSRAARHEVEVEGRNVPYVNESEHEGSVSFRSPRENLQSWSEAVKSDPNAPSRHKAVAAHGYELTHPMSTVGEGTLDNSTQLQLNLGRSKVGAASAAVHEQADRMWSQKEHQNQTKPRLRRDVQVPRTKQATTPFIPYG
jgi:hypothetical protein